MRAEVRRPSWLSHRASRQTKTACRPVLPSHVGSTGWGAGERGMGMRATKQMQVTGTLGLCLLSAPLLRLAWLRAPSSPPALPRSGSRPPPRSPSVEAWLAGWRCWREAGMAVNREREALEVWDPATEQMDQEGMRRQLMAMDRGGHLRRARQAALQAI